MKSKRASVIRLLCGAAAIGMVWLLSYIVRADVSAGVFGHQLQWETGPGWSAFTLRRAGAGMVIHLGLIDTQQRQRLQYPRIFSQQNEYRFFIPFWMLTLLAASAVVARLPFPEREIKPGHCANCGYDLRATPDRCPECGKAPDRVACVGGPAEGT